MRLEQTWVGAGIKVGGIAIAGAETFEGVATRLDDGANPWQEVNVTSIRLGLGLGGSIGVSIFLAFNVNTLWEVNGKSITDWGLNIAVPALKVNVQSVGWELDLAKYVEGSKFLSREFVRGMTPEKLAKLRDLASFVYNAATDGGDGATGGEPVLMVLDVPEVGWGAELSVFLTGGEFSAGNTL
jgi:hypothetical protein